MLIPLSGPLLGCILSRHRVRDGMLARFVYVDVGKDACGGGGKFQKASIDEAYLEPTRRTLTAELHLVQKDKNPERPSTVASNTQGEERWTKRTRNGEDAHPFKRSGGNQCHPSCSGGQAKCLSGSESGASQSQGGGTGEEASAWDIASPSDEQPSSSGRRRDGLAVPRSKDDEQEENRLLQAGGLLGKRIQRTLREVLDYDCSVGVAGNKVCAMLPQDRCGTRRSRRQMAVAVVIDDAIGFCRDSAVALAAREGLKRMVAISQWYSRAEETLSL